MDDMITLFRGDDTAFGGDKSLRVTIETQESLADCCAELEVCGVVKRVRDVSTGTFYVSFTGEDTARMPLGEHTATLRVFDAESRRRTVSNTIRVRVTERVDLVYANEQSVNVALGAMVAWRNVRDKPSINGVVLDGDKTTKELGIKGVVEAELVDLPEDYTTDDLRTALNKINACLRASMASLALAACALLAPLAGFCAATETNRVETQRMGAVSSKSNVVTDVCLDGLATDDDIDAVSSDLSTHVSTKRGNPHGVTAADVDVTLVQTYYNFVTNSASVDVVVTNAETGVVGTNKQTIVTVVSNKADAVLSVGDVSVSVCPSDASIVCIGNGAKAQADSNVAIGMNASAVYGNQETAVGWGAKAYCDYATAIGTHATAMGYRATAIGTRANAGEEGVAIGAQSDAKSGALCIGNYSEAIKKSFVIGNYSLAEGEDGLVLGNDSWSRGENTIVIGNGSKPTDGDHYATYGSAGAISIGYQIPIAASNSVAVGYHAHSANNGYRNDRGFSLCGHETVALGSWTRTDRDGAIACGSRAMATYTNSIAIGFNSYAGGLNATAIGPYALALTNDSFATPYSPERFYFNSSYMNTDATPVSLQTLLAERVAMNKIEAALDALDPGTATPKDIVAALQSIYKHTVVFSDDIGGVASTNIVRDGLCVKQPEAPSAYAYIFDGWFEDGATNSFDFANTPITNDVTLTAKWTPAVAAVSEAGRDATNLCATLAEAFDQAVMSMTPATVTILRDATLPLNETAIHGSGSNDTFITIHNDKTVTIGRPNFTGAFEITGATVVFEGSGSWIDTRTSGSDHSRFCIGADDYPSAGVYAGEPANVIVNGGTFEMGNLIAHLWNVAYGTLTFNGGTIKSGYAKGAAKYCVRAEVQGHVVINGGTFEGANTKQPVLAKDSGTVSITGLYETKFAVKDCDESYVTPMAAYLADGYEFKLGEGYYWVESNF